MSGRKLRWSGHCSNISIFWENSFIAKDTLSLRLLVFDQTLKIPKTPIWHLISEGAITSIDNPRYTIFDGPLKSKGRLGWIIKSVFGSGMLDKVYLRLGWLKSSLICLKVQVYFCLLLIAIEWKQQLNLSVDLWYWTFFWLNEFRSC